MNTAQNELDLHLYFSGAWAAPLGLRSSLGGQLELARLGARPDNCDLGVQMTETSLFASWSIARVESVLQRLPKTHQRVLWQYYTPLGAGEAHGLAPLSVYLRVVCAQHSRYKMLRLCARCRVPGKEGVAARGQVAFLTREAYARVTSAKQAYAQGCEARERTVYDDRPWYAIW